MRILGLIPARGGSKGVPKKNIKLLGGKPLLQYTTEVALKSKLLSKVVLSSDDDEIIEIGKKLGLEVPYRRPELLADDNSPTLPVIQHMLQFLKDKYNEEFDTVCLLQVTTPFRTVEFLDNAIQKFIKSDVDSLISVQKVPHEYNPHWVFVRNHIGNLEIATGDKEIIARRQELPEAFHRDGSIYITKTETLLKKKSLYGDSVAHIESPKESYVNIDTIDDWKKAEIIVGLNKF
ncbi:acylneuraminate cytidylyltransferase family protein [Aureibaculum sp. 2210JD6-5]|uniref:acylneuraminate cytidylyltransferase family protein n=1 Tax=Aureibaculum sp. 2210JD6-5 TaxID=3103957 RepID=UPI002AAD0E54|nr:acylneuraminate cytidylyltransferase family protein [Aureibaculum sp. 2210JD6-5]MDY7394207.1 acylneuraminate cytidylyltransferase family protein [Aureibaculum sp. 2210JD6-5]